MSTPQTPLPPAERASRLTEVAVVIPDFNERHSIREVVNGVLSVAATVLVVDDGSTDGTAEMIADLPVRVIRQDRNRGKAAALVAGFRAALSHRVNAVVTLDGDGQHRPDDILRLVERWRAAPDGIVIGSRMANAADFPKDRYRANQIANFWISWACGYPIEDSQSGFRLYPRAVLERVGGRDDPGRGFVFESEILINAARAGFGAAFVPIPALYDAEPKRRSHFRPVKDITAIVLMVAGKLLRWGMYPAGLYRVLKAQRDTKS